MGYLNCTDKKQCKITEDAMQLAREVSGHTVLAHVWVNWTVSESMVQPTFFAKTLKEKKTQREALFLCNKALFCHSCLFLV